jgi:hypothetical protein
MKILYIIMGRMGLEGFEPTVSSYHQEKKLFSHRRLAPYLPFTSRLGYRPMGSLFS